MTKGFLVALAGLCMAGGVAMAQAPGALDFPQKKETPPFWDTCTNLKECNPDCGDRCACGPPGQFWIGAEYLYWWTKDMSVPPLVTSGSVADSIPGALNQPGTRTLLGGGTDSEGESGFRFYVGFWLNDAHTFGLEGDYLFLGGNSKTFVAGASGVTGSAVITRPFLDIPATGAAPFQISEIVAFPGTAAGTVNVHTTSQLQGAEVNGLYNLCCTDTCCGGYRFDLLGGFRWLQLDESLTIAENISPTATINGAFPAGSNVIVIDQFSTRNEFYGGQIGLRGEWWRDRFFINGRVLLALGDTHQEV